MGFFLRDAPASSGAGGVGYLHAYRNRRPRVDWNTCAQAAVATLLDFHGLDPYGLPRPVRDPRSGGRHWEDGEVIDRLKADFPPDYLGGVFGTSPERISAALSWAGLETRVLRSRDRGEGRGIWSEAKRWISAGFPAIAILQPGKLGGRPLSAHWTVAHRVSDSGESPPNVHLGNFRRPVVPEDEFLRAFRCPVLPPRFNHCVVLARPAGTGES